MDLGVGGHFDVEVIARLGTDKGHQIAGVVEFATGAIAAGQITPQGHQTLDAHGLERGELFAHAGLGRPDARKMRSRAHALGQDLAHGVKGALLCRAPRAVSHRAKLRLFCVERLAHGAQLIGTFGRLGREKFKTQ